MYVYVGSAWGPGGLAARVRRHIQGGKTRRWHIDYLRQWAHPVALWLAPNEHVECTWVGHLLGLPGARVIVPRFGASDCRCAAHLIYFDTVPFDSIVLPGASWADRLITCSF
jgi:Uri superfamily endonuclease